MEYTFLRVKKMYRPLNKMTEGTDVMSAGGHKVRVGSRRMVWHGTAHHTPGGLTKKDIMLNKWGRLVSRKKSAKAKKEKRLEKAGYKTKKGKFGAVKVEKKKTRRN